MFYGSLRPNRNEELLCDYHRLVVKSLNSSERKELSNQLRPRSVSGQVHKNRFSRRSGTISGEISFTCERGLFSNAGTPATNRGRRLQTLEAPFALLWPG